MTRRDTIRMHIHSLMEDMYREEEVLKAKLLESVAHCTKELAELCTQLSVPFDGVSSEHCVPCFGLICVLCSTAI